MNDASHQSSWKDASGALLRCFAYRPERIVQDERDAAAFASVLADAPLNPTIGERSHWRGRVDSAALRARHSNREILLRHMPAGSGAQTFYLALEQARVDAIGAAALPGTRANLAAHLAVEERLSKWLASASLPDSDGAKAAVFAARRRFNAPVPVELPTDSAAVALSAQTLDVIEQLAVVLFDQDAFARASRGLIAQVDAEDSDPPDETAARREPMPEPEPDEPRDPEPQPDPVQRNAESSPHDKAATQRALARYRVYTTDFDVVVHASQLADSLQLQRLRSKLDDELRGRTQSVARWAHQLQRRLMARQRRAWEFDVEEGLLDAGRLSRLLTRPLEPLAFKQELETPFVSTAITILIDNSGSMRGQPITMAAICAELLGIVLERCGVTSEILGFTTRGWRGGHARERWASNGRPEHPGRLTDLKHIIYKDARTPWRRARAGFGAMLDESLLKENVDGEALIWAHSRLLARPEQRRILMTVSDGAPLDDATITANDAGYLDRHLRAVIADIERHSPVELLAIGIKHDVAAYYRRAVTLSDARNLGETMVKQLLELFDKPVRRNRRQ